MELSTTSQDLEEEDDEVNKARQWRIEKMHVPGTESKSVRRKFIRSE
uniref:Uncharacterized protein n=1 Tax=Arundo donax TaxID=35708 RepID=A0A0A9EVX8_ARUDO